MIWHGSDQRWWKPDMAPRESVSGQWKALDWCDKDQMEAHLEGVRKAGVTVVIADLTNGWNWLDSRCRTIQALCAKKGLKFCVAENSTGDRARFESHAKDVWNKFAGPDAPYHDTYFTYHGRPLIVCYAIRDWYKAYFTSDSPYRSRFSLVWASGEDSSADKWGWQLEPWVGSVASKDSMFVTSSVKWNSKDPAMWRKSLAWLDYNFALAGKNNPEYVIVGSYDDPTERNGWLVSDTSKCDAGRQTRGKTGALSNTAYYDRVRQWISGRPNTQPGGLLKDGAYRIINRADGKELGVADVKNGGVPGAALGATTGDKAPLGLLWLYHLGGNRYRIIVLSSGLAIESSDGSRVVQNWESADKTQRWTLTRTKDKYFRLKNEASGKTLSLDAGGAAVLAQPSNDRSQQWRFQAMLTL